MARNRSIIHQKRKGKRSLVELDITSLLDILVILLVFLIRSYNASGVDVTLPEGITLPMSQSQSAINPAVMVQVSKDKIWVDSDTVLSSEIVDKNIYDHGGRRIIPLYNALVKKKEEVEKLLLQSPHAKPFSGLVNLIVDKSIKYNYLKKLMYTCGEAGYKEFKFVVKGEE